MTGSLMHTASLPVLFAQRPASFRLVYWRSCLNRVEFCGRGCYLDITGCRTHRFSSFRKSRALSTLGSFAFLALISYSPEIKWLLCNSDSSSTASALRCRSRHNSRAIVLLIEG